MRPLLLLTLLVGCATPRSAMLYNYEDCMDLRRGERKASTVRSGATYAASGFAAGGVIAGAAKGEGAALWLAVGALASGAVVMGADTYAKSARAEWEEECPQVAPVPVAE